MTEGEGAYGVRVRGEDEDEGLSWGEVGGEGVRLGVREKGWG